MAPRSPENETGGRLGESAAADWLEERGFRIEARNYRCRAGEVDIVGWQRDSLVFVEVRSRRSALFGQPAESVDSVKQRRLVRAAALYLQRFGATPPPCRFDVIEVLTGKPGAPVIRHIPDAFRPGWR